jgi:hypothetical protein
VAHNRTGIGVAHGVRRTLIRLNSIYDNPDGGILDQTDEVPVAPELKLAHDLRFGIFVEYKVSVPGFDRGEVDFYATPSCEKNGAGEKWIGTEKAPVSEARGTGLLARLAVGTAITATLTTDRRGTSEFSKCVEPKAKPN